MHKILLFVTISLLISACSSIRPQISKPLKVTIISSMLKINDLGFLHRYKNYSELQVYASANPILKLKTGKKICVNSACYSAREFNSKFFGDEYYDDFLNDILLAKPIFDGLEIVKNECGFYQNISKFSLRYSVCDDKITFFDDGKNIKIAIKEIK